MMAAVHETALGLDEAGVLDKQTMKAFDHMCLTPVVSLSPDQIRKALGTKLAEPGLNYWLNVELHTDPNWDE